MNPIIKIENLSKQYRLGDIGTGTLSHDLNRWWAKLRGKEDPFLKIGETNTQNTKGESDYVWALKDINIEVMPGEVLGIIGKNGAGKSTLLKLLSRVTAPTIGSIKARGRIASLLEVGTGFHPELTGRENIFLNGAILGMTKAEIRSKFDEIVDFAGVERYIDTPVKRYSSGMYVRLAFAVAAHLEPEILVVDEVLAVGDAEFQKKAIGKMQDVSSNHGRTVLFVSHNMAAIRKLCCKSVLLENGSKALEGDTNTVLDKYLFRDTKKTNLFKPIVIKELDVVVTKIAINEQDGGKVFPFKPLRVDIEINAQRDINSVGLEVLISHKDTTGLLFATNSKQTKNLDIPIRKGFNSFSCIIDNFNLCSGNYQLGFSINDPWIKHYYHDTEIMTFNVSEIILADSRTQSLPAYGHVYLDHNWHINNDK